MHVDLRPKWLMLTGVVLLSSSILLGASDFFNSAVEVLDSVKRQYLVQYGEPMNVMKYLAKCFGEGQQACANVYLQSWKIPDWLKAVHLTNFVLGAVFWWYARIWKPETAYRRQVRVAAGRVDELKEKSTSKPAGTLAMAKVKQ
ncbi:hypothetical protein [Deinococcus cellulosilyticus]|uniref:Uncharacterized protein n=1 Tax=Deinococcus cellulosilyticus (strain DSM 18568 / NBRC 106333 / KACC 11606 / 5516J-15) TaxID=1223518 RepID=A0A511NAS4_DEIC1|nr:hypothetical protein [Deinococcus cellulosilyticus]GEM49913.1 hypothetical protein DC3_55480 [Deinococcus cellulosilyticus NBRC 106333 = KACC 11606]